MFTENNKKLHHSFIRPLRRQDKLVSISQGRVKHHKVVRNKQDRQFRYYLGYGPQNIYIWMFLAKMKSVRSLSSEHNWAKSVYISYGPCSSLHHSVPRLYKEAMQERYNPEQYPWPDGYPVNAFGYIVSAVEENVGRKRKSTLGHS